VVVRRNALPVRLRQRGRRASVRRVQVGSRDGRCVARWVPPLLQRSLATVRRLMRGRCTVIEAELKARVRDPGALRERLRQWADEEISIYRDTYYDLPGRPLAAEGRELRVRVVETGGMRRTLLTYKEPAVDAESGSKPEH